jgi:hypothetical protein
MNIFVLDRDPLVAARYHCDKHVPKMVLETAQMLCTARHMHGLDAPYKRAYEKHPCTQWVASSLHNYQWTWCLGMGLGMEYEKRFGKTHKSYEVIRRLAKGSANMAEDMTPFAQAMPDEYRQECAVDAYRSYYLGDKARFATWDRSEIPSWWH